MEIDDPVEKNRATINNEFEKSVSDHSGERPRPAGYTRDGSPITHKMKADELVRNIFQE